MGEICRMQILYSGWPQGVGLRFEVPKIAKQFHLNGWVTNRLDGKVEVVVEGSQQDIDAFIAFLDRKYDFLISPKEKEIKKLKVDRNLTDFQSNL